ncbi:NfeD family protein [Agrilactobacillus yilanensis]|uniref:NfeD family protein n=1 Tax=Agrilactobacillus yilanensis TaxID=2485997 RepID=A0ABW4JCT3_9LACO|nr:NfeD family protein [Agrilactobacillus yilanensis]
MLDQRLIGQRFTNTTATDSGTVRFFGILYRYRLTEPVAIGEILEVTEVTPSYLLVQPYIPELKY